MIGSLDVLLFDTNKKITEEEMIEIVRGIAAGMYHLHNHNIVHRDLAARNILLTANREPKISVHHLIFTSYYSFVSLSIEILLKAEKSKKKILVQDFGMSRVLEGNEGRVCFCLFVCFYEK
jgi:serine/threonine protein kinase